MSDVASNEDESSDSVESRECVKKTRISRDSESEGSTSTPLDHQPNVIYSLSKLEPGRALFELHRTLKEALASKWDFCSGWECELYCKSDDDDEADTKAEEGDVEDDDDKRNEEYLFDYDAWVYSGDEIYCEIEKVDLNKYDDKNSCIYWTRLNV